MTERDVFIAALQKEGPAQRRAYLDNACARRPELRQQVESLLRLYERAGNFLEAPAAGSAPTGALCDAERATSVDAAGALIGPYKLIEPIGEGGMGTVWMAQQTEPVKRLVAVKLIKAGMGSKQVIARFEAERQALALMDHPNIARVLDGGTTEQGRPYFVMDLVKGVPITRYCDEHHLTLRQRLELFLPVCQAVQHAHQKGIIHRDLKPSNVLVALYDGKPVPTVIDFGVAKAAGPPLTEKTLVTGFGAIVGTLEYMSPEQAEINQLDIDTRSDIYSLGVLLYELLAGSPPFSRKDLEKAGMLEMLRVIREQEPSRPSTKLSTADGLPTLAAKRGTEPAKLTRLVRDELDWIVMKALEKDRNRRYETANSFALDLQRYLADERVLACPPSAAYRLRKFVRRNKGAVLAAVLILLALIVGVIGTTWQAVRADQQRRIAEESEQKVLVVLAAETKAREAEQKARDQAMIALRAMTDEIVENQMARATNLTDENKEFLRKIIKHFEGFAAVTADDAESRVIRAEGLARVGLMRYRLGELKEAETAYADALAIFKRLADDFPARPEFRRELALTHNKRGVLLSNTGRPQEAETAYAEALAIFKRLADDFPGQPEFRQALAGAHSNLGNVFHETGRPQEAEATYADALAIRKQLAADFPALPNIRRALAGSHNNLGWLLHSTGRVKEAETAYADALVVWKQLATDFPTRPEFRVELARSLSNLGNLMKEADRLKDAEASYADALAIRKQLAADFPARPDFRNDLAGSHLSRGALLQRTGRLKEAEASYADALAIARQLAADFPSRPEFRQKLAWGHNHLGGLLRDTGRLKEAEAAHADALAIAQQLATDFPDLPDMRNEAAHTLIMLANLCNQRRDFKMAKAYLEEALPHHQAVLKANPQKPGYRWAFGRNLRALVQANAGLQDQAAAVQAAHQLRDLGWDSPLNAHDAGCALALCIPVVEKDDQLDAAKRQAAVQFYGDQAMTMLGAAVAKGYKDAARMRKDTDLDLLRGREDFKKLLVELEAKQKEP